MLLSHVFLFLVLLAPAAAIQTVVNEGWKARSDAGSQRIYRKEKSLAILAGHGKRSTQRQSGKQKQPVVMTADGEVSHDQSDHLFEAEARFLNLEKERDHPDLYLKQKKASSATGTSLEVALANSSAWTPGVATKTYVSGDGKKIEIGGRPRVGKMWYEDEKSQGMMIYSMMKVKLGKIECYILNSESPPQAYPKEPEPNCAGTKKFVWCVDLVGNIAKKCCNCGNYKSDHTPYIPPSALTSCDSKGNQALTNGESDQNGFTWTRHAYNPTADSTGHHPIYNTDPDR